MSEPQLPKMVAVFPNSIWDGLTPEIDRRDAFHQSGPWTTRKIIEEIVAIQTFFKPQVSDLTITQQQHANFDDVAPLHAILCGPSLFLRWFSSTWSNDGSNDLVILTLDMRTLKFPLAVLGGHSGTGVVYRGTTYDWSSFREIPFEFAWNSPYDTATLTLITGTTFAVDSSGSFDFLIPLFASD